MNSAKRLKSLLDKAFVFEYISLLVYLAYTIFDKFSLRERFELSLIVGDNIANIFSNYGTQFWGIPLLLYILFFVYKCSVTIKAHSVAIEFADSLYVNTSDTSSEKLSFLLKYSKYLYSIYVTIFVLMFLMQHFVFINIYIMFTLFYVYTWLKARDYSKKIRFSELGSLVA